jgi:uncharacterized membrane protein YdjX (TVP38/TMEM64 family)
MEQRNGGGAEKSPGAASPRPSGGAPPAVKAGVLSAFLILTFLGIRFSEVGTHLSKDRIQALVTGSGLLAPAVHVLVYALGTTALVPSTLFLLAGAVMFGKFRGSLYNGVGAIGAAALSFLAARYLGRDFVARWATGRLGELDAKAEEHGFLLICYLRLAYVPFTPVSYAAGLTRIRFRDYLLGTTVGTLPKIFIITTFVDEATSLGSPGDLLGLRFLVPLTLLAASWLLPVLVKRLAPGLGAMRPAAWNSS